jgi:hypothetical protein
MTVLQGIDHWVAQDHSGADIKLVPSIRPADSIENRPLRRREINLTGCECIDLEGRNGLSEYSRARLWIRCSRNRRNRISNVEICSAEHGVSPKSAL